MCPGVQVSNPDYYKIWVLSKPTTHSFPMLCNFNIFIKEKHTKQDSLQPDYKTTPAINKTKQNKNRHSSKEKIISFYKTSKTNPNLELCIINYLHYFKMFIHKDNGTSIKIHQVSRQTRRTLLKKPLTPIHCNSQ